MNWAAIGALWGLLLAGGAALIWRSVTHPRVPQSKTSQWTEKLRHAGLDSTVRFVVVSGLVVGAIGATLAGALTGIPLFSALVFVALALMPWMTIQMRAKKAARSRREVWPDVVDDILAGIRAGIALPEVLASLATRGPEQVRPSFALFSKLIHSGMPFHQAVDQLKESFADPVADRILEALKLANEVGGSELTSLLRDLNVMLRADLKVRSELSARQSWTIVGARLAVVSPWIVLVLMSLKASGAKAYATPAGSMVLLLGALVSAACYFAMLKLGAVKEDSRLAK